MRLNRYLSASGVASRRRAEDFIRAGRVAVNGETVTDPARDVSPGSDHVAVDGVERQIAVEKRCYVLNKPAGTLVSRGDTHGRRTVYDLLGPDAGGVFAVGRLDYDTSGVLILTDDGDLAHRLMHPSWEIDKVYRAVVSGRVTEKDVDKIARGIVLEDGPVSPSVMRVLNTTGETSSVELVLHEGRKRQVRRMLDHIGHPVIALERISFGGIDAAGLAPGEYRPLTGDERDRLKLLVTLA